MTVEPTSNQQGEIPAIEQAWYVPPMPPPPTGWLVYNLDFILATLQGCAANPEQTNHSGGWVVIGRIVQFFMSIAQAILMFLSWLPFISMFMETLARVFSRNPLGFFLRACYWKTKLRHLGQNTIIDQNVEIWGASSVSVGSCCHLDTNVRMAAGERRHGQHGWITIGNYVHLGPGVHIAGRGGVEIQNMVGVSANAHFYSATNTFEKPSDPGQLISMSHMVPYDQQYVYEKPIIIEEYAFIGMMARIMPGVRVGRAAIVHANTELVRDVPALANYGGVARGRIIGWRKPRRLSPRFALGTKPAGFEKIAQYEEREPVIREVVNASEWETLVQIANLHCEAFREGVTTQLGRNFIYRYYTAMIKSETAHLWVAERGGKVLGFLGCCTDRIAFEHANRSGSTRLLAIWRLLTFRLSPMAIMRAMRKQSLSHDFPDKAELLSIVVSPTSRRLGLGKRFLDIWLKTLRDTGLNEFVVYTDNPEGISFYNKYGGTLLFKFRLRDLYSACYRFKLPEGESLSWAGGYTTQVGHTSENVGG